MWQEINNKTLSLIADPLLRWYRSQSRSLPWRDDPQPYYVWISEIMLQQTRVEAVKPYFDRFITALPTVGDLAAVSLDDLLKLWEGLGYYSRARNLNKTAIRVVEEYGGHLPADYEKLLLLPGIGPYTAGAIASIAYGKAVPAVDGNVLRVITRVLADDRDITKESTRKAIQNQLQQIIPADAPGDFNQALMELGAMVCVPKGAPKCHSCPLRQICLAHDRGIAASLPVKAAQKARRIEEKTVFRIIADGKTALRQRPGKGLLAGMWELPYVEGCLSLKETELFLQSAGLIPEKIRPLPAAKHIFTHIEWQMIGYEAVVRPPMEHSPFTWASRREVADEYAVPSAFAVYLDESME